MSQATHRGRNQEVMQPVRVIMKTVEVVKGRHPRRLVTPQARAMRDGWYFTGDLVYEDEDGDMYTVGRVDDMIISGGENIYPVEVEDVVLRHPDVAEACVVGLPDERWGQRVTAFIVPKRQSDGTPVRLTPEGLDTFCQNAADLANFKRPRQYTFVDALPKSPPASCCDDSYWLEQMKGTNLMSDSLRVEHDEPVATIWIDNQDKRNALTVAMRNALAGIFQSLDAEQGVRAIVIRGAGGKAFSAGGDITEFLSLDPADLEQWGETLTWAERCRKLRLVPVTMPTGCGTCRRRSVR